MIIIRSGKFKNKKLQTPDADVRPTSDKIRQAIFNILRSRALPDLQNAWVLDAFAGTGALGLEALSQGAAQAWFMENNPAVRKILEENLKCAGAQAMLLAVDACIPPRASHAMHIIFLDPPYGKNLLASAITSLHQNSWIDADTLLVIESDADEELILPSDFKIIDERKYGRTKIIFAILT